MQEVKVAYRVIAVDERKHLVDDLLSKLGEPQSSAFYDKERNGSLWNASRVWASYKDLPKDITHICLLCDDCDVVDNFKDAVQKCVEHFPDAIWTFANRPQVKGNQRGANTPYIKIWNCWIRGICCLMPVKYIDDWFAFLHRYFGDNPKWSYEDTTTSLFALMNNIDVMMPIPNLAIGKDVHSVIKGHTRLNRNRDSSCWFGHNIDLGPFDTNEFVVSTNRGGFEFHLYKDEEILLLAQKKIKRMREIEKLTRCVAK